MNRKSEIIQTEKELQEIKNRNEENVNKINFLTKNLNKNSQEIDKLKNETITRSDLPTKLSQLNNDIISNDFTNEYKIKVDGIENNANNYIHPQKHDVSMIEGISKIGKTGDYNDLVNKPIIPSINNTLTSDSNADGLSANQGKILNEKIGEINSSLEDITKEQEKVFQSVSNGKACVASAITDKGVTTLANDTFSVMANNISKIKVGDYKKGQTLDSSKYTLKYTTNKLDHYVKNRFVPDIIGGNVVMDKANNFFSTTGQYYNYIKDEINLLSYPVLKFDNRKLYYDNKNDNIYCYANNGTTEIHISKVNGWSKTIPVEEDNRNVYINNMNIINAEQIELVYTVKTSASATYRTYVLVINSNSGQLIKTKIFNSSLINNSAYHVLLNIENTYKYCFVENESKKVYIFDSNLNQLELKTMDIIPYGCHPLRVFENNFILYHLSNEDLFLLDYNNGTEVRIESSCKFSFLNEKNIITFNTRNNTITKYQYSNHNYQKISSCNSPLTVESYNCNANDAFLLMKMYNDKTYLYTIEEQIPSSITLK